MNIHSSTYNPNGLRSYITIDGREIEIDNLSEFFEGVDVSRIDNPQEWAEATAQTTQTVINDNRGDDSEPEMTDEERIGMTADLVTWIEYLQDTSA